MPAWIGIALILLLLIAHLSYYAYLEVDDAYILYRYARNLARGDGLLFNPGFQPVEGYSSFLWVVILAGIMRSGLQIPVTAKLIGGALSLLTLIGTAYVLRWSGARKYTIWVACAWIAASGSYAMWSISGLESALAAALAILSLILLIREDQLGHGYASGFALVLVALVRVEGAIFFFTALTVRLIAHIRGRSTRPRYEELKWLLAFVIPFGVYLLWRFSYYGYWLPNTVYVKTGGGYIYHGLRGVNYLFQFLAAGGALLAVLIVAAVLLRANMPLVQYAFLGSVFYVALITIAGGDWMPQFRFFVPILSWLCALAAIGLEAITMQWPAADQKRSIAFASFISLLILGLFLGGSIHAQEIARTIRIFSAPFADNLFKAT